MKSKILCFLFILCANLCQAALPTILINSATGSDTQASGAGPGTALFGSTGITSADGLTVSLLTDNPDLSGVATDGSAVIFMSDTNAGSRNFGKITGVDNSVGVKTVTVSDAFQATNTDAWAIGGKRANLTSTTSIKLLENNAGSGDAMPGWIMEMESGHSDAAYNGTITLRRAGTVAAGSITLRGTSGAGTRPILTFSNNGSALSTSGNYWSLKDFEMQNTNATKTSSNALRSTAGVGLLFDNIKVDHSTNKFNNCFSTSNGADLLVSNCDFGYAATSGVNTSASSNALTLRNCWIHNSTSHGITRSAASQVFMSDCLLVNNSGDGMNDANAAAGTSVRLQISNNTFDANTGDGIEITGTSTNLQDFFQMKLINNIFSNNGGYGINFSGSGIDATLLNTVGSRILNNDIYNNATATNPATINDTNTITTNPTFTNSGSNDYSVGTNMKAFGYPLGGTLYIGTLSSTYSYVDVGASQRQEPASSSNDVFGVVQ